MATTSFSGGTVIPVAWCNDVDALVWDVFGGATTAALARTALGSTTVGDALFITASAAAARTTLAAAGSGDVTASGLTQSTAKLLGRTTASTGAIEEISVTASTGLSFTGGALSGIDSSSTVKGVVELATSAELITGTDTARAVTPEDIKTALGFSGFYTNSASPSTITAAGLLTLGHGLGRAPKFVQMKLKCTTGEYNYSINDELYVTLTQDAGASYGAAVYADTTNVYVRIGSNATSFLITDKTSGAVAAITNASWQLIVQAWG